MLLYLIKQGIFVVLAACIVDSTVTHLHPRAYVDRASSPNVLLVLKQAGSQDLQNQCRVTIESYSDSISFVCGAVRVPHNLLLLPPVISTGFL
jgi:hypothetical protein